MPGPGGPDSGLMLRNGQQIIPPPMVGSSLSPAEFGPPGLSPDMRGPGEGGFGGRGSGLGAWEQPGPPTFWVGFDYLMWWQKSQPLESALVTTSSAGSAGVVGSPSTTSVLGSGSLSVGRINGLRQWFGFYTDEERRNGMEFTWFLMENRSFGQNFQSSTAGLPLYAIPFRDATTGNAGSYVISSPLSQVGGIQFATQSQAYNIEGNCILNLYRGDEGSGNGIDFLVGMRFFDLQESMSLDTRTTNYPGVTLPFSGLTVGAANPVGITTSDRVRSFNEFYGLNLGLRGDHNYGRIYWGWTAKFAAGYMNSYTDVMGSSTLNNLGVASTAAGGRFFDAADIGRHKDGDFAFIPEGGLNLGYQLTPKVRLQMGYTFMYVSRVIRPGSSFDQSINNRALPTDPNYGLAPSAAYNRDLTKNTDYFLQGINFGLQFGF
ncbi:BBP7 family outer membrane beta-barrel protein [Zavarzinella formosa]|uniref:BBP7 family outer membrane beta-barrel protein n=1 Tax=Zavarzinella formosa TaxID=360055 RepID=UPI001930DA30|nr:BBP7 family outer membrane beta-barrel protein [Zavarzinella formosa]